METSHGTLHTEEVFESRLVEPRRIDVWVPPIAGHERTWPVVYMHDGQNLFQSEHATHRIAWEVHGAVLALMRQGRIPGAIIVGIWNTARRLQEYMPQRALSCRSGLCRDPGFPLGGPPLSDSYIRFLVEELKPWIDRTYPVRPERESTFVLGSSMGGLVSLYAVCEAPNVFAGAGCVSTHWTPYDGIVIDYLDTALPQPGRHRLYFDFGTEELDAGYEPFQERADAVLRQRGWQEGKDFLTRKFPGAGHSEAAWRERVHVPLEFLLSPCAE